MTGKLMQISSKPAIFAVVAMDPISVLTLQEGDWLEVNLFGVLVAGRVDERGGELVLRTEHHGDIRVVWLTGKTTTLTREAVPA